MVGKIYIASMNMRGKWAESPDDCVIVNATSMQGKNNKNRRDFSPMTFKNYKDFPNFEAYWQSRRIYEDLDYEKCLKWWKSIKEPKRRYPNSKNKKVKYARFLDNDDVKLNYIESRKQIYVPEYYELTKNTEMALYYKNELENGKNIVVYDLDGPRLSDGTPTCLEINIESLKQKINDQSYPFGHGYVVASIIAGINVSSYID
jgi:hypothetical protein